MKRYQLAFLCCALALSTASCGLIGTPKRVTVNASGQEIGFKLPRRLPAGQALEIRIPGLTWEWTGYLYYRRADEQGEWTSTLFWMDEGMEMVSQLPLPELMEPGDKLEYYVVLTNSSTGESIRTPEQPVVLVYN